MRIQASPSDLSVHSQSYPAKKQNKAKKTLTQMEDRQTLSHILIPEPLNNLSGTFSVYREPQVCGGEEVLEC